MRHALRVVGAAVLSVAFAHPALSQGFKPDPVDLAAAKKEGVVNWYCSGVPAQVTALVELFQKTHGIRVELFRSGGADVLRRTLTELDAGHPGADVALFSDVAAANGLAKKGSLLAFKPVGFDKFVDVAKDPNGYWIANRVQLFGMAARTDKLDAKDLPAAWADLRHPKYKGKLITPDPNYTAAASIVVSELAKRYGWDYFKDLKANGLMIMKGHNEVLTLMQQGERAISVEFVDPRVYNKGKEFGNLKIIWPKEGVLVVPSPAMILKNAPHPNAAKVFAQFLASAEAQKINVQHGFNSGRGDVAGPPGAPSVAEVPLLKVDFVALESTLPGIKEKFQQMFQ